MDNVDKMLEDAHKDVDRFIEFRGSQLKALLANKPTGRILKGHKTYAQGWEDGFRRCLAELEKASKKL